MTVVPMCEVVFLTCAQTTPPVDEPSYDSMPQFSTTDPPESDVNIRSAGTVWPLRLTVCWIWPPLPANFRDAWLR